MGEMVNTPGMGVITREGDSNTGPNTWYAKLHTSGAIRHSPRTSTRRGSQVDIPTVGLSVFGVLLIDKYFLLIK